MQETSFKRVGFVLFLILLISGSLMFYLSRHDAAITDESAHIPAGYSYVKYQDYRLNPEHPPLLKALAALPLLNLSLNFPVASDFWQKDINAQWDIGRVFIYESGNDADQIIQTARVFPIILTLLTALLIFMFSSQFLGRAWALLPTFLFALSPTVLAHGHFVTTDIAAAFGILLSLVFYLRYLYTSSGKNLVFAGLAAGVAELCKFSAVLLGPFLFGLAIIWAMTLAYRDELGASKIKIFFIYAFKKIAATIGIFLIGYLLIVYPVYFLLTRNYPQARQTADTEYLLSTYSLGPTPAGKICTLTRCPADLTIWASKHNATRPLAEYALGVLMVVQRAAGGNSNYFLGNLSKAGTRDYFPVVYSLKETLPALLLLFIGLLATILAIFKKSKNQDSLNKKVKNYLDNNFTQLTLLLFALFYWVYSMRTPLNIGYRHLMPSVPLIYILIASAWKNWFVNPSFWKKLLLGVLCAWAVIEIIIAFPYYLSYFNQIGGGTMSGYKYVTDSNYDWGQDLLRFRDWVNENKIDKIAVDYFGGGNPSYYLPGKAVDWWSSKGNPKTQGINYIAISINSLEGAFGKPTGDFVLRPEDSYSWLGAIKQAPPGLGSVPIPDYRVGTTIFVYKL